MYAVKALAWPYVADAAAAWRARRAAAAAAAAPAAAGAAALAAAIGAQTAELGASIAAMRALVAKLDAALPAAAAAGAAADGALTADALRRELRAFAASLNELAAPGAAAAAAPPRLEAELAEIKGLLTEYLRSPRSGERTPPTPGAPSARGTPARGGGAPAAGGGAGDAETDPAAAVASAAAPSVPPAAHPASYMDVLEMLERGQTPPGIRADIDDDAPDPRAAPSGARRSPPPKPWERAARSAGARVAASSGAASVAAGGAAAGSAGSPPGGGAGAARAGTPDSAGSLSFSGALGSLDGGGGGGSSASATASPREAMNGRRHASSIYEAATGSPGEAPGLVAGRLSPAREGRRPAGPDGAGLGRAQSRGWAPPPLPSPSLGAGGEEGGGEGGA